MSTLGYFYLKAIASIIRLVQPCPVTSLSYDEVLHIPSRDPSRTIKAHVYRPKNPENQQSAAPVLINFHGSGFILHWHGSDDHFCRRIADETNYTVLDIQYRLGPEYPFPAAPNDAEDVVKYTLSRPGEYDPARISLSGFSAGGNLALGVAVAGAFPKGVFRSLVLFYPPIDFTIDHGLKTAPDPSGAPIPAAVARIFNQCYFGDQDTRHPLISPALANVNLLPENVLVITCACDSLAPEAESFAQRANNEIRPGSLHLVSKRIDGVNHAWDKSIEKDSEGERKRDEAYAMAIELLRR
ncbi:Alpha/Beta hydrolase protein [Aspergillus carlsbadensis]|nr:Alpha/Beta hydrolase protein [Aspergillus carlsbadensis]